MTSRKTIDDFLAHKNLAVVGVSRNPKDFTRMLFREFKKRGYQLTPVNPQAEEIEGIRAVATVRDAIVTADAALLLTNPHVTVQVVRECYEAGIRNIWLYRAVGAGAVSPSAIEFCAEKGINLVAGECPFMFLPETGFPHNLHGFCRKLIGHYPN